MTDHGVDTRVGLVHPPVSGGLANLRINLTSQRLDQHQDTINRILERVRELERAQEAAQEAAPSLNALEVFAEDERLREECQRLEAENKRLRAALSQVFDLSDRLEANTRALETSR